MSDTEQKVFWKRIGYVAIEGRDGGMHAYGGTSGTSLDFKFEGEKIGSIYTTFSVGILGLTMDTINDLTIWNPAEAFAKKRRIQVFAGYEKDGISNPLFDGFIIEAMPTNPPEMWMNFKCMCNFDKNTPVEECEIANGSVEEIFSAVCAKLEMGKRIEIADNSKFKDKKFKFPLVGSRAELIDKFANTFNLTVWEDGGTLVLRDKRPWINTPSNATEVSTATGMLGLGNITLVGARIRRRLDDTARVGSWVFLKSAIVPKANGNYYVIKKRHVGQFRGDDWYTELECIREQKGK